MSEQRFSGKSVLVTGAGSGIGRATARLFASEGADVVAFDVAESVHDTAEKCGAMITRQGDASSAADVVALFETMEAALGGVDIVIANAGISGGSGGIFELGEEDWATILRVNLIGSFLAVKHGAQAMLKRKRAGAIVCTASIAGLRAGAGGPAYSASKAGVINLVQSAAQQLSGSGIRVNAVCPGLIETEMTRTIYERARAKGNQALIGQLNPMRRGGEPGEIAGVIAFLASDVASYINGQALAVDGGLSSSHPFARPPGLGASSF